MAQKKSLRTYSENEAHFYEISYISFIFFKNLLQVSFYYYTSGSLSHELENFIIYRILKVKSLPRNRHILHAYRTGGVKIRNRPPRIIWFSFCRTVRKSAQEPLQVELALLRPFMSFEIANDFRMYIICACWW